MGQMSREKHEKPAPGEATSVDAVGQAHAATPDLEGQRSTAERELLQQVWRALGEIRYGSVVLTVHDGRVVEIQKNERIRYDPGKRGT